MHQAQAPMCLLQLARPCFPASCSAQAALPHLFGQALRLQQAPVRALQCGLTSCQAYSLQGQLGFSEY